MGSTPKNLNPPEQNNEHRSKCFYTHIIEPNCLLIDCVENIMIEGNSHEWGDIPILRYKDSFHLLSDKQWKNKLRMRLNLHKCACIA